VSGDVTSSAVILSGTEIFRTALFGKRRLMGVAGRSEAGFSRDAQRISGQ